MTLRGYPALELLRALTILGRAVNLALTAEDVSGPERAQRLSDANGEAALALRHLEAAMAAIDVELEAL